MTTVLDSREISDDYLTVDDMKHLIEDMPSDARIFVRTDDGIWVEATELKVAAEDAF